MKSALETELGTIVEGDALEAMRALATGSIDLIVTSPPFALTRKKAYGNAPEDAYIEWMRPFALEMHRVLAEHGSLAMDTGSAWRPGLPVKSLWQAKLVIMLCEEAGFHLAQEIAWWNPSKMPGPAEWVTIRRIRLKDAINTVWWLGKTPWPRASNRRVLEPYSKSMRALIARGCRDAVRPSGHVVGPGFDTDNGGAIAPNLIALAHTESNSHYLRRCREENIAAHPARFPPDIPEFFIRLTTDPGDSVLDPFAGSATTGEACERLGRRWLCVEDTAEYVRGARLRFEPGNTGTERAGKGGRAYVARAPGSLWKGADQSAEAPLDPEGGRRRRGRG